jgi:hypothetical protein
VVALLGSGKELVATSSKIKISAKRDFLTCPKRWKNIVGTNAINIFMARSLPRMIS